MILHLIAAVLHLSAAQKVWTVQMDGAAKMTASLNGQQQWSTIASSKEGVCQPLALSIFAWLCPIKQVKLSDIIDAGGGRAVIPSSTVLFVASPNIYAQITPSVYRVTLADSFPYVQYVTPFGNVTWLCDRVLLIPHYGGTFSNQTFRCFGGDLSVTITESNKGSDYLSVVSAEAGVSDEIIAKLVALTISRFRESYVRASEPSTIAEELDDRKMAARGAVGWIWFCISVVCFMLVLKITIWQAWLWPGPQICCTCWMRFALVIWFVIFSIIFLACSAGGGLPGLIIIVIIICTYLLILKIIYCCRSRNVSTEDDSLASHGFARYPIKFGSSQNRTLCIVYMILFVFFVAAACTVKWWNMRDYIVYNRITQQSEVEFIKPSVATAVAMVYSFDGYANKLNINNQLFKYSTALCGIKFGTVLANDEEKRTEIYEQMIATYNIDMSIFIPSDYRQYNTVNEWFIRTLKPGTRPIHQENDVVVAPADARTMTFTVVPVDLLLWIKGEDFTVQTLLGPGFRNAFQNGAMAMCRLAPQDYHRFHSPVTGVIVQQGDLAGSLYAVNADGMTSGNNAIYNQRSFTIIQTRNMGDVAVVAIGATCVGSVVMTKTLNMTVNAGDELGYFQFGGSTVALVFEEGAIKWDADLRAYSSNNVETFVNMGTRLGSRRVINR